MKCPYCDAINQTRVLETTPDQQGTIRRRRECQACGKRFSTMERVIAGMPVVIKSDGRRQEYDREKLLRGIRLACAKRPVSTGEIDRLVERIEEKLQKMGRAEVQGKFIGDMVIENLKSLDLVAYIRYATVYMNLNNLESIRDQINEVLGETDPDQE